MSNALLALVLVFSVFVLEANERERKDRIMTLCAEKQIYAECQKAWEGE